MNSTTVNGSNAAGPAGSDTAAADTISSNGGSSAAISNMFTTLLVAQIKNQDPTQPADPTTFVNQLAQLSQMQAMQKLADQGGTSNSTLQSLQLLALGGQVGSNVQAKVDGLTLGNQPVTTHFTLQSNASHATMVLTGDDGSVHKIDMGPANAGANTFSLNPVTAGLMPGHFAIDVETSSNETAGIEISAPISSVTVGGNGKPVLTLGSFAQVDPSAITQFNGRSDTTAPSLH